MPTTRIYEAQKKVGNFIKQQDDSVGDISSRLQNKGDTSTCRTNISTHVENIHGDVDFSIFEDKEQSITTKNTISNQKAFAQYKAKDNDASQFFYDQTTVKDLHSKPKSEHADILKQQARKPLGILADEQDFAMPSKPNFELTDTITMTSRVRFEPDSASTRFIKPCLVQSREPAQNIDATADFEKEIEEAEAEKEKLLLKHATHKSEEGSSNQTSSAKKLNLWSPENPGDLCSTKKVKFETTANSFDPGVTKISAGRTTMTPNTSSKFDALEYDDEFEKTRPGCHLASKQDNDATDQTDSELSRLISPSNKLFTEKLPIFAAKNKAANSLG